MTNLEDLYALMTKVEDLHPDLVPYLVDDGPFGLCLKHPLVFSIVHTPEQNAMVNARYLQKEAAVRKALAAQQWASVVWIYERPYRVDAFQSISWHLDGPDYWELFGRVWSDSENQWQNRAEWREMAEADPEGREMMSSPKVRSVFTLAPEDGGLAPMTRVFRGFCHDDAVDGMSWTLDESRAAWFARRLRDDDDPPARVASGMVAREHVIAYITSRDEQEFVVLPENVTGLTIKEVVS